MNTATMNAQQAPAPQSNALKIIAIIFGIFFALLVTVGVVCFANYVSASNAGVRYEESLKATKRNNENIYAQYTQKVAEAAQVPAMFRDDLSRLVKEALQGRYGADGSKAVFQSIREQNPQLDPQLYRTIQQIIVAGRNEFQTGQQRLIDQRQVYETHLGYFWEGMWMKFAGYPKIRLEEFNAVTTDAAAGVFKAGKETGPLQIGPK